MRCGAQRSCPHSVGMAAAALWGYPRAPCPLRIWGMCLMVGPSALELTPSSWLFPDLLPLRVLEPSKAANWYAPQQERFGGAGCRRLYCTQLLPCRHMTCCSHRDLDSFQRMLANLRATRAAPLVELANSRATRAPRVA